MEVVDSIEHVINTATFDTSIKDFIPTQKFTGYGERKRKVRDEQSGRVGLFPQFFQVHVPIGGSIKYGLYNTSSEYSERSCQFSWKRCRVRRTEEGSDNTVANCDRPMASTPPKLPMSYFNYSTVATTTEEVTGTKSGEKGDFKLDDCKVLYSAASHNYYEVIRFLGRGSFGQVVKCRKKDSNEVVAIKILKNLPMYVRQGQIEISILSRLNRENVDQFNLVKWHESFQHHGHTFLVFEMLAQNLFSFQRQNQITPLPFKFVRLLLQQILTALSKLKEIGIIHLDLKPENIMLVDPIRQPYRVKVIDFGSACHVSSVFRDNYAQSRYYRAPEVILGLPFFEAVDMWSLGCIAAELRLGFPLYPGMSEYDQLLYISQTQGLPTNKILNLASKTRKFFRPDLRDTASTTPLWRLKVPLTNSFDQTPEEYQADTGIESKETRKFRLSCLDDIINQDFIPGDLKGGELSVEKTDRKEFMDLLTKMLAIEQNRRITPQEALNHAFVTLAHLIDYSHYPNAQESFEVLQSFRRRESSYIDAQKASAPVLSPIPPSRVPAPLANMTLGFPPTVYTNQYVLYGENVEAHHQLEPASSNSILRPQVIHPLLDPPFCQVTTEVPTQAQSRYFPVSLANQNSQGVQTSWLNGYPVFTLPTEMPSATGASQK